MAGLYCNLAIKVQLILKMQLICSLLKNLSFKIIRRSALFIYLFFCSKKIRKENNLNNLTTSILSFPHHPRER